MIFDTKINTSGFDAGVSTLSGKAKSALSTVGGSIASGVGSIATGALKAASAAVVAGFTAEVGAVVKLTKDAVSNYADYEQLVGGVETLFKDSASTVIANADKSFKTAGTSANDYMDTVTSFSASLLQSLNGDTAKAAKVADRALTDMSDNANKMGTDFKMIQNAYQGFAKQNWTMLDNLKLGYGGNKTEMNRLIDDANKLKKANGEMADLSIESFADVVEAIGLIQDKMGITGTTAKEAATTIQGSFGMVKASFKNLLTGMADPSRDVDELFDQLEESVGTALDNVMPAIDTAAPRVTEGLVRAIKTGVEGLANNPDLSSNVSSSLSMLLDGAIEIMDVGNGNFHKIADGIFHGLKDAFTPERIGELIGGVLTGAINTLNFTADQGVELFKNLLAGLQEVSPEMLSDFAGSLVDLVSGMLGSAGDITETLVELIIPLASGLIKAAPELVAAAVAAPFEMIEGMISGLLDSAAKAAKEAAEKHKQEIIEIAPYAFKTPDEVAAEIETEAGYSWENGKLVFPELEGAPTLDDWTPPDYVEQATSEIKEGMAQVADEAEKEVEEALSNIDAAQASAQLVADMQSELESALSKLKDTGGLTNVGTMMLEAIVAGMQDAGNLEALSEAVTGIKTAIVGDEESSIAKEFEDAGRDMGSSLSAGVAAGISEGSEGIKSALSDAVSAAIAEARAQVNAFAQDPFGGTRPNLTGSTTTNNTTNNTSFTFNSPKALNYREMRDEVLRYDQYQRAMTP